MSTAKKQQTGATRFFKVLKHKLKRFGRIAWALLRKLWSLAAEKLTDFYHWLLRQPPKALATGFAGLCLGLVIILIVAIASPKRNRKETVPAQQTEQTVSATAVPLTSGNFAPAGTITGEPAAVSTAVPASAETEEPEVTATPFATITKGYEGSIVEEIQSRLMELGYMDSDEPTEHYGSLTVTAVKAFQRHNGLSADGTTGGATYSLLMNPSAKEYVMQSGDSGEDVEAVQQRLFELGYISNKSNITGTFGDKTETAVRDFQTSNKLTADGKVGNKTLQLLYSDNVVSKFYSVGDEAEEIKTYQQRLKKLGYYTGSVNGEYTKATAKAVKEFQDDNDLVADGNLGPATREILLSSNAQSKVIKLGDKGSDVKKIQQRLAELGYIKKANATGYYGQLTEDAVRAFQKRNGLSQDGKVGTGTLSKLNSKSAKQAVTAVDTGKTETSSGKDSSGSNTGGSSFESTISGSGVERLISAAESKLGCKYVSGAKGPNTFDCSGFVYWCLKQAGVKTGYMTSIVWRSCTKYKKITSMSDLKRGDILVFSGSTMAYGHVGIYLGNGKMIDAGSSAGCVRISTTVLRSGGYWPKHFLMAYRVF